MPNLWAFHPLLFECAVLATHCSDLIGVFFYIHNLFLGVSGNSFLNLTFLSVWVFATHCFSTCILRASVFGHSFLNLSCVPNLWAFHPLLFECAVFVLGHLPI